MHHQDSDDETLQS